MSKRKKNRKKKHGLARRGNALEGLFGGEVPWWLAGAAALAGGVLVFNLVKMADPKAS